MLHIAENTSINSDDAVIEKIIMGDQPLFEILIRRYNPVLYKIARSFGFNHQDAQDIMQEAHVAAFINLPHFEKRSSYKTWISKITVNKCLYQLKYGYFKNESPVDHFQEHQPLGMSAKNIQPEEKTINRELALILEKSLQNIPVIYRTVFVLREVEGCSVAETAELLEISTTNVKARLNRAKAYLQKEIEKVYSQSEVYSFNLIYCDAIVHRVFESINQWQALSKNRDL